MIKVFNATDKIYSSNGDIVLNPTKAVVHKEDNGDFYLDLETPLTEATVREQTAIPGITAVGSNINIQNVDLMLDFDYKILGETTQSGTPTSSTPIEIKTITGNNLITITGNNLLPTSEDDWEQGTINSSTGDNQSSTKRMRTKDYYPISPGKHYASIQGEGYVWLNLEYYDENWEFIKAQSAISTVNGLTEKVLSVPAGTAYFRAVIRNTDTDATVLPSEITLAKAQIEDNSKNDFEEYKSITNQINLGKNMWGGFASDFSRTNNHVSFVNNADGTFTADGTASSAAASMLATQAASNNRMITLEPGNYALSGNITGCRLQLCDSSNTVVAATSTSVASTFFTLAERKKVFLRLYVTSGTQLDNVTVYPMLERGYLPTTYSPYFIPIELCKIGDYQDYIYKQNNKWYIHKDIGKITDDAGSLNITINDMVSNASIYSYCGGTVSDKTITYDSALVETNTIYYPLETPTDTEITDSTLLSQLNAVSLYSGVNNIFAKGYLNPQLYLDYNHKYADATIAKYIDYLVPNNIIVANTPQGDQAFRISNIENSRKKSRIKAYHVFYDSKNLLIKDSYVVDKSCNDALDHLNNATSDLSPFTTISNITSINSYRCVRKSLYEAINVVLERWGGHLVRNNFDIAINDSIGQDNGVVIRYAKNLKNITATYDWSKVVTKLLPVGKEGILLNALDPNASVYVTSATQYDIPYTKTISFSQDINEEDYIVDGELDEVAYKTALVNDLLTQAQIYIGYNSIPHVNYSLSANVEKVSDIGDTIEVIDEKLGINVMTNIISYDYDCILDKYINLEFGNFQNSLSNLRKDMTSYTEKVVEENTEQLRITLGQEINEATAQIWNALGNSYVVYEGDKILIVDTLPKENATNVIMINSGGIGFSQNGINGTFQSAWTIDNVLNMANINVINLTADLIKGGTLKLGSNFNQNGVLEVYDEANSLIAELNKSGLKMYGVDGSYVLMNNTVGFSGYDRNDNRIYWVDKDEFHMKKSVVEEEITLCNKLRFIPITIMNGNTVVNDGIGLVSVPGGGN